MKSFLLALFAAVLAAQANAQKGFDGPTGKPYIYKTTAEYRMLGKGDAKLPAGESKKRVCVTDAKSAIHWFKQHAAELGIDPDRIITGGGSAGGHISALATMNPGLNDPADPKDIDTSAVAHLWFNPAFAPEDNKDPWRSHTLIEADKFLVKHGLLTGEPTLKMPASGEKLVPAP